MNPFRPTFRSDSLGEEALCRSCQRAGYGVDSWHPATSDFFRIKAGKLSFGKCIACTTEVQARKVGFVTAEAMDA